MLSKHSFERKNAELSSILDYDDLQEYHSHVHSPSSSLLSSSAATSPSSTYSPLPSYTSTLSNLEEELSSGRHRRHHHHHHHHLFSTQVRRLKSRVQDRLDIQYGFLPATSSDSDSEYGVDEYDYDELEEEERAGKVDQKRREEIAERDQSIVYSQMTPDNMSYTYAIKKQLVAVSMSFNLSLMRAKRRVRSFTKKH